MEENVKNLGRECWVDGDITVSSLLDNQCKEEIWRNKKCTFIIGHLYKLKCL